MVTHSLSLFHCYLPFTRLPHTLPFLLSPYCGPKTPPATPNLPFSKPLPPLPPPPPYGFSWTPRSLLSSLYRVSIAHRAHAPLSPQPRSSHPTDTKVRRDARQTCARNLLPIYPQLAPDLDLQTRSICEC